MCAEGRPDETEGGIRFFEGTVSDAFLQRSAPARGYAIVVWRGRHVPDVSEMHAEEAADYWQEVLEVARALDTIFEPCHLNYDLLGNLVPHVHTHIVPRYLDDPSPNMPLKPWEPVPVPEAELRDQVARLRGVFSDGERSQ
jgi:diadenosine tetraphosphate (Ap4A) HIT family hydrolase